MQSTMQQQRPDGMIRRRCDGHGDVLAVSRLEEAGALAVLEPSEGFVAEGWVMPVPAAADGKEDASREARAPSGEEKTATNDRRHVAKTLLLMAPEPPLARAIRHYYWKREGDRVAAVDVKRRVRIGMVGSALIQAYWAAVAAAGYYPTDDLGVWAPGRRVH